MVVLPQIKPVMLVQMLLPVWMLQLKPYSSNVFNSNFSSMLFCFHFDFHRSICNICEGM